MTRLMTALVVGSLLVGAPALAQTPPPPQTPPKPPSPASQVPPPAVAVPFPDGVKIAFLDFQRVANESAIGKTATTKLKMLGDAKGAELQKKNVDLQAMQKKQKDGQGILNEQALTQLQRDIDKLSMDIQYSQQTAQKEADDMTNELMNEFYKQVVPVAEAVAKEKGLWAVFSMQDSGPVFVMPGLDISAEVVKRLDAIKK